MNRNYKVIWNHALGCFTAVAEYAKSRGKSSSSVVSSHSSNASNTLSTNTSIAYEHSLRPTTLRSSLVAIGLTSLALSISPSVIAEVGVSGGIGNGTAISNCSGAEQANSGNNAENIAVGCSSSTNHSGLRIADRGNPYYTDNATNAALVDAADRNAYTPRGEDAGSVAIGTGAKTESPLGLALGEYATTTDIAGVAIGLGSLSKGNTALALGRQSTATADYAQAIGNVAAATGKGSLAVGHSATATGYRSIAIGATDIENASSSYGQLGANYQAVGQTKATADSAIAFGGGAQATADNALALGTFSAATEVGSVAIGSSSVANIAGGAIGYIPGSASAADQAAITATNSSTLGAVSVGGGPDGNRQIVNVAAGTNASDAVNVSQLTAVDNQVTTNTNEITKGIKFNVDGLERTYALGDTIGVTTDDNIDVTATANGAKFSLANTINIGTDNSVTIDGDTGIISGLTNTIFDADTVYTGGQAATQEQLSALNTDITNLGFNIAADNGSTDNVKLGDTVTYNSADGSIVTTVSDNQIDFALGNNLNVGGPGQDGASGTDGIIGINGVDGTSGITISGKDGTIGINGADGANGIISVVDGVPGVDGEDGITRIVIDDIEVATMEDGLKFAGNTGTTIAKKLNETLSIEGELAAIADATGTNLRVDSDGDKLNLVMAKNLIDLDSVTIGDTVINTNGLTITNGPTFTKNEINAAGNTITNVAAGVSGTDAANVSQIVNAAAASRTEVVAGTNVASVTQGTGANGQNIYTVNANGSATTAGSTAVTVTSITDANNLTTNAVDLSDDTKDSLVKADNSVQYDNTDQTSVTLGGTSATAPVNLTNVASGDLSANSTDAVNGSQLFDTNENVTANANDITTNTDNIGSNTTNITNAQNQINQGFNLNADNGDEDNVQLSETVNFTNTDGNLVATVTDNGINYDLADVINIGSDNTINIDGSAGTVSGLTNTTFDVDTIYTGGLAATQEQLAAVNASTSSNINKGLNFAGDSGANINSQLGDTLSITGGETDSTKLADGNNIGVTTNGNNGLNVQLAKDLTGLNSATFSDVILSTTGLNNGDNKIINVADGNIAAGSKDAVNGSQLNQVIQSVNTAVTQAKTTVTQGTNIVVTKTTDTLTGADNYEVTTADDLVVDSVTTGNTVTNNSGITIDDGAGNNTTVTTAGTTVTNTAGDSTNYGAQGMVATDSDGNSTVVNSSGVSFADNNGDATGPTITASGINSGNTVITGLADGIDDDDAVNLGQLQSTVADANKGFNITAQGINSSNVGSDESVDFHSKNDNIIISKTVNSDAATFDLSAGLIEDNNDVGFELNPNLNLGNEGSVTTGNTTVNNAGVTIVNGPSLTAAGINGGGQIITGVADGIDFDDAVNLGQLNAIGINLNSAINDFGYRIDDVADDANAGISAAMAMSSIPQSFLPGKSMVGGGISTYNGESAVAIGVSKVSDNGRWVIKVNGTADTQGNAGGAVGAGFHF